MPPETVPIETLLWLVTKVTPPCVTTMLCVGRFRVHDIKNDRTQGKGSVYNDFINS